MRSPSSPRSRERTTARVRAADRLRSVPIASSSPAGQERSSRSTTSVSASAASATEGACATATCAGRSRRTRSASWRSRPTSSIFGRVVARLSGIMLDLPLVGTGDVDQVAHLVQPGEDARPHPLLQVLRRLAVGAELPAGGSGPGVVGREQGGTSGVVADADDLVEHSLLELAVLAALADLVDGQHVHLAQRLQPLARGETAG